MKLARLFGYVILVASTAYFFAALARHADALPGIAWNQATFVVLLACLVLYLAQVASAGLAWHFWLSAAREASHPRLAISLFAISQLAKYIPGGIAQHIARVALGERHGFSTPGMIVTMALEQSWALVASIALAGTMAALLGSGPEGISLPSPATLALIVGLALAVPAGILWLGGERRPAFLDGWLGAWRATHPGRGTVAICVLLYAAGIANAGWNIDLIARYVLGAEAGHAALAIGVFAVAWVAGVVTVVSPGGIGVREAVLVAGLTPAYGPGIALAAAMSHRAVASLGDALAFLLGLLLEKHLPRVNRE